MGLDPMHRIDRYLDEVPRAAARVEDVGGLRLFVKTDARGWPYYARPIPDGPAPTRVDVAAVRARQREQGLPEAFEWLAETAPSFARVAEEDGLAVTWHPLLVAEAGDLERPGPPPDVTIRLAGRDEDHAMLAAVAMTGFEAPGTAVGADDRADVERRTRSIPAEAVAFQRGRAEGGLTVPAVAEVHGRIVAVGFHQPAGGISEVVGVATLPAFRRRGIAGALTALLATDAFDRGVEVVVLSAGDDEIARVYERVGFRRIGAAGAAEPRG